MLVEASIPRKSGAMPAPRKYPSELRERAARLVLESREQDEKLSLNAAVLRIGPRVGVNPDTLRGWCNQAEIDSGRCPGTTTADAARVRELEAEVRELKRCSRVCRPSASRCGASAAWHISARCATGPRSVRSRQGPPLSRSTRRVRCQRATRPRIRFGLPSGGLASAGPTSWVG